MDLWIPGIFESLVKEEEKKQDEVVVQNVVNVQEVTHVDRNTLASNSLHYDIVAATKSPSGTLALRV